MDLACAPDAGRLLVATGFPSLLLYEQDWRDGTKRHGGGHPEECLPPASPDSEEPASDDIELHGPYFFTS